MYFYGYSFWVLKIVYFVVDNIIWLIFRGNKDVICNWVEDKICSYFYWIFGRVMGFNFDKLFFKDILLVLVMGYIVVCFWMDNLGYWFFYCYFMLYLIEGMGLIFNVFYEYYLFVFWGFLIC